MASRSYQALWAESMAWIRENPNATTHDVPDSLVEMWVCEIEEDSSPTGFYLSIFAFGYFQQQLLAGNGARDQTPRIGAQKLIELFKMWQLKLGLVEVHRRTDIKVAPMPLFAFPQDEAIQCWRT